MGKWRAKDLPLLLALQYVWICPRAPKRGGLIFSALDPNRAIINIDLRSEFNTRSHNGLVCSDRI